MEALQTFSDLSDKINSAVKAGNSFKINFVFSKEEEASLKEPSPVQPPVPQKKGWFSFGSETKTLKGLSWEDLSKKPDRVEAEDKDVGMLQKASLKELREYLKKKFLHPVVRPFIWKKFIKNECSLTEKTFEAYKKIIENRQDGPNDGSKGLMRQKINDLIQKMGSSVARIEEKAIDSVVKILEVFELFRPEIGYVIGTEKVVFFLRVIVGIEEAWTFIIFHNIYFNSDFLWGLLTNDEKPVQKGLNFLEQLVNNYSKHKDIYKANKADLERLFIESSQTLFIGVFPNEVVERLLDHLILSPPYPLPLCFLSILPLLTPSLSFDAGGVSARLSSWLVRARGDKGGREEMLKGGGYGF